MARRAVTVGTAALAAGVCLFAAAETPPELRKAVDALDRFIQARFARAGDTRIVGVPAHSPAQLFAGVMGGGPVRELQAGGHSYVLAVLSVPHAKAPTGNNPPPPANNGCTILMQAGAAFRSGPPPNVSTRSQMTQMSEHMGSRVLDIQQQQEKFNRAAQQVLPTAAKGKPVDTATDGWLIALRPAKAQSGCVGCHKGAKAGDVLGVMMYAVREAKDPPPARRLIPRSAAPGNRPPGRRP